MPQKPARSASAKKALPFWVLYAALAFLAFSPCLLLNRAYFDNDLLAQFGPWRFFLKDQLAQGHFPLWNPYLLGGQPFFADLQNMMFYPFNYLTLPFSVPYGLGVFFFLHAFWSACGMHLWLRSLNLSSNACRVGAILFAFSNFFWLEIIHPPVIAAFAWLPWLFASVENLSQNPKPRNAFYAGLAFAMLFLCGSFQVTVGALYAATVYLLFALWKNKTFRYFPQKKFTPWVLVLFLLWGLSPLLGQLIPTMEFSALTDRRTSGQSYEEFNGNLALNPAILYQLIFPRINLWNGQTIDQVLQDTHGDPKGAPPFIANLGYLGALLPFLIGLAYWGKEKKNAAFFSSLGLFSLLLCFGKYLPLNRWICDFLPGFSLIRVPFRFIYLYVLAAAALAAFGFDRWEKLSADEKNRRKILIGGVAYVFLAYLAALINPAQTWRELISLFLGVCAWTLAVWKPAQIKKASLLFIISLLLPLFLTGWSDFKTAPASNFNYEKNSFSLGPLGRSLKPNRLMLDILQMNYPLQHEGRQDIEVYPSNAACVLDIKTLSGYNPLVLSQKKDLLSLPFPTLIRLGALSGIVSGADHGLIPDFKLESIPPFYLYRYQKPLFYLFAPSAREIIPDPSKRLERLKKPDYNPYQLTLLSQPLPADLNQRLSVQTTRLQYQIHQDDPDNQKYTVETDHDSLVVFADPMFPGWKALVDGQSAPIFTADHFLRSVYVPAGKHEVEFKFIPNWFAPIIGLGLLWILSVILYFYFSTRRN